MGWFAPRRHQESFVGWPCDFFLGGGGAFQWSRACHSDRILATVCSLLLSSGCLRGRALRDGDVKTKLGIEIIDAMASTMWNGSEVNGVLLEVDLWSVFHSPNFQTLIMLPGALPFPKLTGPALSQPAFASPQTVSAGAVLRSPPPLCSSLAWGGLPHRLSRPCDQGVHSAGSRCTSTPALSGRETVELCLARPGMSRAPSWRQCPGDNKELNRACSLASCLLELESPGAMK